jgi:hypothetical protein
MYSVGIEAPLPETADEIAECLENVKLGTKQCRGQICTWSLSEDPTHILHVVPIKSEKDIAVMKKLSDEMLVPNISFVKSCGEQTYTITDSAIPATMVKAGPSGGVADIREDETDFITRMTYEEQRDIINLMIRLVESGRIHMHCTLAAIGFTASGARFIDTNGIQSRKWYNGKDKLYALALCLLQMLERTPYDELESTEFFRVAMAAISGQHLWGEELVSSDLTLKILQGRYPIRDSHNFPARSRSVTDTNVDIFRAVMYYCSILAIEDRNIDNKYIYHVLMEIKKIRTA